MWGEHLLLDNNNHLRLENTIVTKTLTTSSEHNSLESVLFKRLNSIKISGNLFCRFHSLHAVFCKFIDLLSFIVAKCTRAHKKH